VGYDFNKNVKLRKERGIDSSKSFFAPTRCFYCRQSSAPFSLAHIHTQGEEGEGVGAGRRWGEGNTQINWLAVASFNIENDFRYYLWEKEFKTARF